MTVIEISECFPNKFKPVTGEFVLQHVRALSEYCKVITIIPLRFLPNSELFSINPFKLISNIYIWFNNLMKTKSFSDKNLTVIYLKYISLPRPFFKSINNNLINFFFYKRIKKLLKVNKPDIIYCNWIRPWAKMSLMLSKSYRVPLIIDHHEDIPSLKNLFPIKYKNFIKIFEKANMIIVHSSVNKTDLIKENLKTPEVKIVYLGQNFSIIDKKKDFNFERIRFACISHLYEQRKNVDVLIKAVALIRSKLNFDLKIIGNGVYKKKLIKLTKTLSLENEIKFLGEKSRQEVEALLTESDIFVLPSYPEAFGVVFIEALAKGLPIVTCYGNGGGEELKSLGYPVILVKPNSSEDLASALVELSQDKFKMSSMSELGKSLIKDYFTWDKNAQSTYKILKDTVKEFKSEV